MNLCKRRDIAAPALNARQGLFTMVLERFVDLLVMDHVIWLQVVSP